MILQGKSACRKGNISTWLYEDILNMSILKEISEEEMNGEQSVLLIIVNLRAERVH